MNNFQPEIQDETMDKFRALFNIPLTTHVVKNGLTMRMRVVSANRAAEYLAKANAIILHHHLPLEAKLSEWKVGQVIFDRWLEIQFDQTKLVPENY
jgi:hypothetical protein